MKAEEDFRSRLGLSAEADAPFEAARPEQAALSPVRIVIRAVLVLTLVALILLGYRLWLLDKPDIYWKSAQAAQAAGRWQDAEILLRNLLRAAPDDPRGHRALAEVYLHQAQAKEPEVTYATYPQALYHLEQACALSPEDLPLQKQLLTACLARRELPRAAAAAGRIADQEPDFAAAILPLLSAAIEANDAQRLEPLFDRLVARLAASPPGELTPRDLLTGAELLLAAVRQSPARTSAERRAGKALATYQALAANQRIAVPKLANGASQIMLAVAVKRDPAASSDPRKESDRLAELDKLAEPLRAAGIAEGEVELLVYYQSALAAFAGGDDEAGLQTLRRGLAAAPPATAPAGADKPGTRGSVDLRLLAARQLILLQRSSEAQTHLDALATDVTSAGWAALLTGWAALSQGKAEIACQHLLRARANLGNVPAVRMVAASAFLALRQWESALEQLQIVQQGFESLTLEDQGWALRLFGAGKPGIHVCQLHAELSLGRWEQAQPHWQALQGTRLESKGAAMVAAYLWTTDRKQQALDRLAAARRHFPREHSLLVVELAILRQQDKTAEAQQLVEEFASTSPADDLQSQVLLCGWRLANGQAQQAWEQLQRVEAGLATSPSRKAAVTVLQAEALLSLGKAEEAVQLIEPLCSDPHVGVAAGVLTAAAQARLANPQQAAAALALTSQFHPDNPVLNHLQGELAAARGDHAQALERLAASLEMTGLRTRAAAVLAPMIRGLAQRRPAAEVQAQIDQLLKRAPQEPHLLVLQAEFALQQEGVAPAYKLLERIALERPTDPLVAVLTAAAWLRANHVQLALLEAQRGLQLDPEHQECLLVAAQASLAAKNTQAAHDYAAMALEKNPHLISAVLVRAQALQALGRRDEAIVGLEVWAQRHPKFVAGYLAWGQSLAAAGKVNQALEAYRRGSRTLPGAPSLLEAEVGLLAVAGRLAEADEVAERAAKAEPTTATCLTLGKAFDAGCRFAPSQAWLRRALSVADEQQQSTVHLLLGMSLARQHRVQANPVALAEARDQFAAAVQADPRNLIAANNLAWLLAKEFKQPTEAARVLEQASEGMSIPALPITLIHTMSVVYRAAGRAEEARRVLEDALARHPDEAKLWLELGTLLADDEQTGKACAALEQALTLGLPALESEQARNLLKSLETSPPPPTGKGPRPSPP